MRVQLALKQVTTHIHVQRSGLAKYVYAFAYAHKYLQLSNTHDLNTIMHRQLDKAIPIVIRGWPEHDLLSDNILVHELDFWACWLDF